MFTDEQSTQDSSTGVGTRTDPFDLTQEMADSEPEGDVQQVPEVRRAVGGRVQGKDWCLTIQDPDPEDVERWAMRLQGASWFKYLVYQWEVAPTTGALHIQAYLECQTRVDQHTIRSTWPGAHIERRAGPRDAARDYCKKADSRMAGTTWIEYGTWVPSAQGRRNDILGLRDRLRAGASDFQLLEDDVTTSAWFRHGRMVDRARLAYTTRTRTKPDLVIYYGDAGSGKTSRAHAEALAEFQSEPYFKSMGDSWWDGYMGEACIIIDEFTGWLPIEALNRLVDRFPYRGATKGGFVGLNPKRVVLTSNTGPKQWWNLGDARNAGAFRGFLRRVTRCVRLTGTYPRVVESEIDVHSVEFTE